MGVGSPNVLIGGAIKLRDTTPEPGCRKLFVVLYEVPVGKILTSSFVMGLTAHHVHL